VERGEDLVGEVEGEYTVEEGRVKIPLDFKRDESKIIALSTDADRFGAAPAAVHAVASEADAGVVYDEDRVIARSTAAGLFSTTLDSGMEYDSSFPAVPAQIDLTGATWNLAAEDWKAANPWATTFGASATQTTKDQVSVTLSGLKPWRQIPELVNASGIGLYTTTFSLPESWSADNGAIIDLGTVVDTFTLSVNGIAVPVDQTTSRVDLRDQLKAGENTLSVRIATTLVNRLATYDTAVNNRGHYQNYGLLGPVVVSPYASVEIDYVAPRITSVELDTRQRIVIQATDDLSGVARIEYSTQKGKQAASPWVEYTGPLQVDAATTVSIRVVDSAGNVSEITQVNRKDLR